MVSRQTQSLLLVGNKLDILQHLQWINGSFSFLTAPVTAEDKFHLEVEWLFRPDTAAVIGAIWLLDEGNNTRILFVPKPFPNKEGPEKFSEFFQQIKDYFKDSILDESDGFSESEQVAQAIINFVQIVAADKRMTFWQTGGPRKRIWIKKPEKQAKNLLQTFLQGWFKTPNIFEEIRAGAGIMDLFFIPPNGESVIIELKMCGHGYSSGYASKGIEQLKHYMESRKAKFGYLVVFDSRVKDYSLGFSNFSSRGELPLKVFFANVCPYVKRNDAPD